MKTLTCPECGVTFAKKRNNQVYCSPKCAKAHYRKANRERMRKKWTCLHGGYDVFSATAPVSFDKLSRAKTKPANTSDIRWRMELRRRAMARRYGQKNLDMLPHPDTPCISASLRLCV